MWYCAGRFKQLAKPGIHMTVSRITVHMQTPVVDVNLNDEMRQTRCIQFVMHGMLGWRERIVIQWR